MKLEDMFLRLDEKLERMAETQAVQTVQMAEMRVQQAHMNISLDEHMRRTAAAEEALAILKQETLTIAHSAVPKSWLWSGLTGGAAVLSAIAGIAKALGKI